MAFPTMYGAVICCGAVHGADWAAVQPDAAAVSAGGDRHVITVIGLSLMPVAGEWLGGGDSVAADFGSCATSALGARRLCDCAAVQRFGRGMLANLSVLLGWSPERRWRRCCSG
jgi:hypothetical protein